MAAVGGRGGLGLFPVSSSQHPAESLRRRFVWTWRAVVQTGFLEAWEALRGREPAFTWLMLSKHSDPCCAALLPSLSGRWLLSWGPVLWREGPRLLADPFHCPSHAHCFLSRCVLSIPLRLPAQAKAWLLPGVTRPCYIMGNRRRALQKGPVKCPPGPLSPVYVLLARPNQGLEASG